MEHELLDQSLSRWIAAVAVTAGVTTVVIIGLRLIGARLMTVSRRSKNVVDDVFAAALDGTHIPIAIALGLRAGDAVLDLPAGTPATVAIAATAGIWLQVAMWANRALRAVLHGYRDRHLERDAGAVTSMAALAFVCQLAIWSIAVLVALDNVGVDVTALVAGLGITGIAVALALQNVLGDLFASLAISIDRPFVIGDLLVVDSFTGRVEKIGLKTTRLRAPSGEQIIIANSGLLGSRIRNYQRMEQRRVELRLALPYGTTADQLEAAVRQIRAAIEAVPGVRFERAHVRGFGAAAFELEAAYVVTDPDHRVFLDAQQAINLKIVRGFEGEHLDLATPPLPSPAPAVTATGTRRVPPS
jgi:small-conductance mechanosensitive channel